MKEFKVPKAFLLSRSVVFSFFLPILFSPLLIFPSSFLFMRFFFLRLFFSFFNISSFFPVFFWNSLSFPFVPAFVFPSYSFFLSFPPQCFRFPLSSPSSFLCSFISFRVPSIQTTVRDHSERPQWDTHWTTRPHRERRRAQEFFFLCDMNFYDEIFAFFSSFRSVFSWVFFLYYYYSGGCFCCHLFPTAFIHDERFRRIFFFCRFFYFLEYFRQFQHGRRHCVLRHGLASASGECSETLHAPRARARIFTCTKPVHARLEVRMTSDGTSRMVIIQTLWMTFMESVDERSAKEEKGHG